MGRREWRVVVKQIPRMQSDEREVNQLQNNILSVVNPLMQQNPILFGNLLQNISLKIGDNIINTGLKTALQGWVRVRQRGPANIYDLQDSNTVIGTLILNSDAVVSVD